MSNQIHFTKMHGLGNDYIYFDCCSQPDIEKQAVQLARWCSQPHFGIGSDGVILICPPTDKRADFRMRMFNADGSEGEMCGNGIRCVGKLIYDHRLSRKKNLKIETKAGIKVLSLFTNSENLVSSVQVDMGVPVHEGEISIPALDRVFHGTRISMGNPHVVIEVDHVADFDVAKYGPVIEKNTQLFPNKTNVEFVERTKQGLKMRVWERGSGETMACGTGACATFEAMTQDNPNTDVCQVQLLGGILKIRRTRDNHILMMGPATTVFEGSLTLSHINQMKKNFNMLRRLSPEHSKE